VKFTPAGGLVTVAVTADDERANLVVTDTGTGIDVDELPRVFERFWRSSRNAVDSPGSGIGLTIVADLVAAHHGTVNAESAPGEGTRINVRLPTASRS